MAGYSIIINETTAAFDAIHAAVTCAKALNIEFVPVHFMDGTHSLIRKDSNIGEACEVYRLRAEVNKLKSEAEASKAKKP